MTIKEQLQKADQITEKFETMLIKLIFKIVYFTIFLYGLKIILTINEIKNHENEAVCFTVLKETFLETIICSKKVLTLWCF